jgi:NRPS condensation-like uncharacterized protein
MTGKINAATSCVFEMAKIKDFTKKKQITVNDLMLSSLSTAMNEYLGG